MELRQGTAVNEITLVTRDRPRLFAEHGGRAGGVGHERGDGGCVCQRRRCGGG